MARLIDAEEVVKAVHDEFDECLVWDESGATTANEFENIILQVPTVDIDAITESHERIGYDRGFRDGYAEALEVVDNVLDKNVGQWILCSERPPAKKGRYLCTVDAEYHNVREMMYDPDEFISEEDRSIWKDTDGYRVFNWFVIAWMPMPKPYKMDEVEDETD